MILRLNSNPQCICEVEDYVKSLVEKYRLRPDIYPNILISLTEAVNNAIKHGNANDETKAVEIRMKKVRETLCFIISDEGRGFDFRSLPDPTSPENIANPGGRGVFLMHQLSDRVRFSDNGSTVELEFNI